jgi:predicted nucleotide-binding protein (sugar kinase/HSP70/actin superfamily)
MGEGDNNTGMLYIITNEQKVNGAAVPFYDKASMDALCDKMGGSMFLIPSSIHEMIALPAGESNQINDPVRAIAEMIVEVNKTEVSDAEILGTKPYHYDKETGFMLAERFEKLNMEMTKEKTMERSMENAMKKAVEIPGMAMSF